MFVSLYVFADQGMPFEKNPHHEMAWQFCHVDRYECAKKEYNMAINELEIELLESSNKSSIYTELGEIYQVFKMVEKAVEYFLKALLLNPDDSLARARLYEILYEKKYDELGYETYLKISETHDSNMYFFFKRGEFLKRIILKLYCSNPEKLDYITGLISDYDNFGDNHFDKGTNGDLRIFLFALIEDFETCFELIQYFEKIDGSIEYRHIERIANSLEISISKEMKDEFLSHFKGMLSIDYSKKDADYISAYITMSCGRDFEKMMLSNVAKTECQCKNHDDIDFKEIYRQQELDAIEWELDNEGWEKWTEEEWEEYEENKIQ